jgi:hypothetical protein
LHDSPTGGVVEVSRECGLDIYGLTSTTPYRETIVVRIAGQMRMRLSVTNKRQIENVLFDGYRPQVVGICLDIARVPHLLRGPRGHRNTGTDDIVLDWYSGVIVDCGHDCAELVVIIHRTIGFWSSSMPGK